MPLRVSELRMPLEGDEEALIAHGLRRAGLGRDEVASVELVRKSLDRRRRPPELVYTIDLHLRAPGRSRRVRQDRRVRMVEEHPLEPLTPGSEPLAHRPVIIGAGPAGLFAALVLARAGYRPLVLERGAKMNERVRHIASFYQGRTVLPESNYLFGEGGAGTFSDGKLTSRSKDPRARLVLDEFRTKSGFEAVAYSYRPHLGSDRVRAVVGQLRREIESLGGTFHYGVRVDHVVIERGRLTGLRTSAGEVPCRVAICAPGHSARDFYANLLEDGVLLEQKPFQMGFRVEHPQEFVDRSLYGEPGLGARLGPADYRLACQVGARGVFSFCMCPGGEIIPAVHDGRHYNTNGMSYFRKDTGFANSGIVVTVEPEEFGGHHPLAGLALQAHYERLAADAAGARFELPAQRLEDFMARRPSAEVPPTSCRSGARPADVARLVPDWIAETVREAFGVFHAQMPGFLGPEAVICGPEARSSSPVRIVRDRATLNSPSADGLLPVGEGAGYAGGIVSAAVDGWRAAEVVVGRFSATAIPTGPTV